MEMDKQDTTRQYRTIRITAPTALLRASAITMVLLCMAAFVCGTATAATMYAPEGGNQTISKVETESILQFENVKSNLTDAQKKLSTDILQLLDSTFLPEGQNRETLEVQMKNSGQFRPESSVSPTGGIGVTGDLVYVYVYLDPSAGTQTIERCVWEITDRDEENHLAVAWVEVNELETLASLDEVRTIRTVIPPLMMTGSVTTKGDAIHRTSDVRATYSQNGSGVKVGIISDGVNSWTGARDSGDLPTDLTVLNNTIGGDEGTAMLEIVHDMVPYADLYFHDCGANTVAFNAAIDALVNAGCDVICDDIGWITQPFFEDGTIASHLTSVLASNDIIYTSSAGNAGQKHYQGDYYNDGYDFHDFSRNATSNDYLYVNIPNNGEVTVVLQWNDQFGSSSNNYNLYLYKYPEYGEPLAYSAYIQDGDDDPLEVFSYTNTAGSAIIAEIDVYNPNGAAATKTLEVFIYPSSGCSVYTNNINATDSIFGHAAVPGAIAVGAIDASDSGNDDIELFSSQGPVTIRYPSPVSRAKPDICGIDGVAVTGAGSFPSTFYGTSAAAPHIAAIAAQLWSAFPNATGDGIRTMLNDSAVDLGSAGYDNIYGYGRADALDAFEAGPPLPCPCGDICVNETGWWRDGCTFNANGTPVQAAVDNATAGETICVRDGTYSENVDVDVAHLTIRSEHGSANCIVNAASSSDHVFEVTVDYVNISGFTVENATFFKAGMYLGANVDHCNISDNGLTNNRAGIWLKDSGNYNTLTKNTANSNAEYGIYLESSSDNNTLTENTVDSNSRGICLDSSSNNTLTSNTASNNGYGIHLDDSSDNNTLTENTANSNTEYGIRLRDSRNNTLTENTANSNYYYGIHLSDADDNNVSCNWVQNNTDAGFYLKSGSTGNKIKKNNIIANGVVQGDGSYRWQFANNQSDDVNIAGNWWGTANTTRINASISDWTYDTGWGNVTTSPKLDGPAPCAPIPEAATVLLFAVGLLMLAGYVRVGRRK